MILTMARGLAVLTSMLATVSLRAHADPGIGSVVPTEGVRIAGMPPGPGTGTLQRTAALHGPAHRPAAGSL